MTDRIGPYLIDSRLGVGGMGVVYAAHDEALEQPVPQLDGDTTEIREINRVLRTAMAKEPAARYCDAAALRDDLRSVQRMVDEEPTAIRAAAPMVPPARSRRGPIGLVAGGLVLLVLLGVAIWAVARPDSPSDPVVDPTAGPATSSTPSSTPSSETSEPTAGPATGNFTGEQRRAALESFATALLTQPAVTQESADCIAETVVDDVGLPTMVEEGFFDEDMTYVDQDLADLPDMKAALTSATFTCVRAG